MQARRDTQSHDDADVAGAEPLVLSLHELGRGDLAVAGGKGANLGELARAGFPVPAGFVVTTESYDRFVDHSRLDKAIDSSIGHEGGGSAIRDAFHGAAIPSEVQHAILTAYRLLGRGPVAVRSSATAEDLPEAAFAGQQDTFLNVLGDDGVLDAVRRCWASLWTDRAIAYRERQGIDQQTVKLAVVVQRMVAPEVAGVMFTANPVTGTRDEIVVDASPGLGEAVVSGLVTPDHFVLERRSGRVKERRQGQREIVIRARPDGGTERLEGSDLGDAPSLPDDALRALARLGVAIEQLFGRPQDIEWASAGGQTFIVQARPMTALPEILPRPTVVERMMMPIFAEMFPVRPYPLDMTSWVPAIFDGAVGPLFRLLGIAVPPLQQMFVEEDDVAVRFIGTAALRPTPRVLLAPVRLLWLAYRYDPADEPADPMLVAARSRVRFLEARESARLSWSELIGTVRESLGLVTPLAGEMRLRYFPRAAAAAAITRIALALLGHGSDFGTLLSGAESNTVKANRALEQLARRVRDDPWLASVFASHEPGALWTTLETEPSGEAFLRELRAFLDSYGHREVVLSTMLRPTWKDAPELVLGIIKGFATTEMRRESDRPVWEAARDKVLRHPMLGNRYLRGAFLRTLTTARYLFKVREDTHFEATSVLPVLRRTVLEMGGRLVRAGVLDGAEDVFYLKMNELEGAGATWPPPESLAAELRATVRGRKKRRAKSEDTPMVDTRLFQLPDPADGANRGAEVLLRGTPGSPGVAEGPARVIRDSSEFAHLRHGEVLVAPYTNPSWTPLFQRAAAVVVDTGGLGSHAAIVAREYGIPAVMATVSGTSTLRDGQRIRVDGSHGLVLVATPRSAAGETREVARGEDGQIQ